MEKDLPDIQQLDPEENDHQFGADERPGTRRYRARREDPFWKGTPQPRPLLQQSLRSSSSFALISLGVNILLLVATCVVGSQRTQLQEELWALKGRISNFSSTLTQLRAVSFHGGSTGNKVTSLETKLEKQVQDLKADHNSLLLHLKHFPADLRTLTCQVAFFRSNGTECCPVNWLEFEGSCYWFSRSGKTWAEAEKYCQLEDSHLVVINSREEQVTKLSPGNLPCREEKDLCLLCQCFRLCSHPTFVSLPTPHPVSLPESHSCVDGSNKSRYGESAVEQQVKRTWRKTQGPSERIPVGAPHSPPARELLCRQ
ncbi:asialoglycoprotein receptor 2 isoform X1 [Erinaceus europaeus]|uniref:Asialoglycoprotein receptor 2 isoform X1 n=1 Tax=Erinaceus europaeus TaxID=9365 RepID=A0ABM3YGQ3_ERIEU|nr:asialoglycoprotein receptor 2 isoform X1 [Erinaceus europaeus]XP_060060249.1 asialoglycoprotein receptor 2 isoform X1 [Erinaceus europaeus]